MDLDFLDVQRPRLAKRRGLVNMYHLLGLSASESAADQTLAYFFDPGERHGMGSALVDALVSLLDGHPTLGAGGRLPESGLVADRSRPAASVCLVRPE